jgi:hypothetical protein
LHNKAGKIVAKNCEKWKKNAERIDLYLDSRFAAAFDSIPTRVARCFIFKPKIPIWVNFGGPWNGKGWYILWPFGIYCGHLVHLKPIGNLLAIWCIFSHFGILCRDKSGNPDSN